MLFLAAVVAAWGSAQASPAIWVVSLACLAAGLSFNWTSRWVVTPLALAVWAYVAWTVFHTAVLSRAYNPTGLFDPLFLFAGFAIARSLDVKQRGQCYTAMAILVGMLALWGGGQLAFGSSRGHAHFETGNTLASVLNLALAPAAVAIAYGARDRRLEMLTVALFAGLCATVSRGGGLAILAAMAITVALGGMQGVRRQPIVRLVLLFVAGAACAALAAVASVWLPRLAADAPVFANLDSVRSRLELYRLAWSTTSFGWGIGYLAFRYVLEVGRAEVPSYGETGVTYFVHNDYLQALLELGIVGLVALVALVGLAVRAGVRLARSNGENRHESLAILAGVLTVSLHALVDFPLHVPLCVLLFGFGLGVLDRLNSPTDERAPAGQAQRLVTLVLASALSVLVARPVIAEAAAAYGMKKWLLGETRAAAYGFEFARRADPRDWRYHLYAGQFWFAQAAQNGQAEQAKLADEAFAAGMAANPLEPSSALGRAFTQLRYGSILPAPAQPLAIRAWAEQALMVAPLNAAVRREYEQIMPRLPAQR